MHTNISLTLAWMLGVSLLINVAMFLIAFARRSDKLTDASYAVSFIALALTALGRAPTRGAFVYVLTAMVLIWAVRIGSFLLFRVIKKGRDRRFDGVREHFWKFGKFWIGQALTAWVLLIPLALALQRSHTVTAGVWVGVVLWAMGVGIEAAADFQKYRFSSNPDNHDRWIAEGVWKYARHPNYFGEILTWIGLYVACFGALTPGGRLVGAASPLLIALLLLFVSGVPILERNADQRWGELAAYRRYKARTSLLIPLPRRHE